MARRGRPRRQPRARGRAGCSRRRRPGRRARGGRAPARTARCARDCHTGGSSATQAAACELREDAPRRRRRRCAACRGPRCAPASARRGPARRATTPAPRPASRRAAGRSARARSGRRRRVTGIRVAPTRPPWRSSSALRVVCALELLQPPAQGEAERRLPRRAAARPPPACARHSRGGRSSRLALHLLDDQPAGGDVVARHRLGHEAAAERRAAGRRSWRCMSLTVSTSWPGSRLRVIGVMPLRRVGHRDGAMADQLAVVDRLGRRRPADGAARPRTRSPSAPRSFIVTPGGSSRPAHARRSPGRPGR